MCNLYISAGNIVLIKPIRKTWSPFIDVSALNTYQAIDFGLTLSLQKDYVCIIGDKYLAGNGMVKIFMKVVHCVKMLTSAFRNRVFLDKSF